jgi:hypothetical protein
MNTVRLRRQSRGQIDEGAHGWRWNMVDSSWKTWAATAMEEWPARWTNLAEKSKRNKNEIKSK